MSGQQSNHSLYYLRYKNDFILIPFSLLVGHPIPTPRNRDDLPAWGWEQHLLPVRVHGLQPKTSFHPKVPWPWVLLWQWRHHDGGWDISNCKTCNTNKHQTICHLQFQKKKKPFEVVFATDGLDEAYHVSVDIKNEMVQRWAVFENVTQEIFGAPGDGSSIDFDEPFVLRKQFKTFIYRQLWSIQFSYRFGCDPDGWMLQVNTDDPYPHFFHLFGPQLVQSVKFSGHGLISFIGFGPRGVNK